MITEKTKPHISDEMLQKASDVYASLSGMANKDHLRKAIEAALSTDAEPVAWQFRCEIFPEWQTTDQKPGDQLQMEYETGVNMKGLEVRALYAAPPAPSVAVKALQEIAAHPADDIRGIAAKTLAALSAQVQDVAGWQDISTAPKDGTEILGSWKNSFTGHWFIQPIKFRDSSFVVTWDFDEIKPTHWMPLPAAPAAKQGEAE